MHQSSHIEMEITKTKKGHKWKVEDDKEKSIDVTYFADMQFIMWTRFDIHTLQTHWFQFGLANHAYKSECCRQQGCLREAINNHLALL